MELSKVHRLLLFTLGSWCREAEKKLEGRPLDLAITKSVFISALTHAGIARKKERALYKNLEFLEKKRLISYKGKCLKLTVWGMKQYQRIAKDLEPVLHILEVLHQEDPLSYSKKVQTHLSLQ